MGYGIVEPDRVGSTRLTDGRQLGWAEWGPPDAAAVLFCPGAATSRELGFGGRVPGVRLISVDRPGLGASDPAPGRTLTGFADDLAELCARRDLPDVRVAGFSQGAPFALACVAAGWPVAAAVVSGTDELASANGLTPEVAAMIEAVRADPDAAERTFASWGDPDGMWQRIVAMSGDRDRAVYTDPVFARAYRRALARAFAQGPAGYARDTVLASDRWPFDLGAVTTPVDIWYGAEDTSPVHSPDLGASLAARIPGARRHVVPGAGGALLWTHAERILRTLLERRPG